MADDVLVMYAGKAVEYGTLDEVFTNPLHPYTWGLMDSIPRAGMSEKSELCPIKGSPPSLIDVPSGCPFHPRCPYAQAVCRTNVPDFRRIDGAHGAACHFAGEVGFVRGCSLEIEPEAV
jgi:oligopeptide transport system ATP-binding protein